MALILRGNSNMTDHHLIFSQLQQVLYFVLCEFESDDVFPSVFVVTLLISSSMSLVSVMG